MKSVFGTLALGILLVACNKKELASTETESRKIELNNCATDGVSTDEICFTEVNDSRCPLNANCVWKGIAVAKFVVNVDATQHQVTLATDKVPGYPSPDTTVGGYRIKLVNITPYPGSQVQEPTKAILEITR